MAVLQQHLIKMNFKLIDAQVMNPHLESLGAKPVKRANFIQLLTQFRDNTVNPAAWIPSEVTLEL